MGIGDWGLGDWGLGIGPNPQSPIPNPQSPIPNPHVFNYLLFFNLIKIKNKIIIIFINKLLIFINNYKYVIPKYRKFCK